MEIEERLLNAEAALLSNIWAIPIIMAAYTINSQKEYQQSIAENKMRREESIRQRELVNILMRHQKGNHGNIEGQNKRVY